MERITEAPSQLLLQSLSAQGGCAVKLTEGKSIKLHQGRLIALIGAAAAGVSMFRAEIKAQLAYNPSGKVIADNEVSYDNGHFIVVVPHAWSCP